MKKKITRLILVFLMCFICFGCSEASSKYYYESAVYKMNSKDYEQAKNFIETAIDSEPDKAEYHICNGMISIKLKEYNEALSEFKRAISDVDNITAKQNNKNAYRGMGIANLDSYVYDEAIKNFDEALSINELSEMDIDILEYKAQALLGNNAYEEVSNVCDEILKKDEKNTDVYIIKGNSLVSQGDYDAAKKSFDSALEKNNTDAYYYIANMYKKQGETMKALETLQEYINKDSSVNKAMIYSEMAPCMIDATDYDGALNVIKKGLELNDSEYTQSLMCSEIALYEGKLDYQTAYEKAQQYVDKYPDDDDMSNELLFLANRLGE